ncbi:uncharacterized protein N7477_002063 [Penicillium maclennaniae]|uniref:uncharacterized protein n=1 Tax=Penicillium maclennaniae TaxID=1343394 RepID=UPI002540C01E|nr:uncharacterized protein N7477_002063 [Penicillium maclennaniae]KAJ5682123.1 hypothetical protein N7477_002063 [Penicillium maclennaniae]
MAPSLLVDQPGEQLIAAPARPLDKRIIKTSTPNPSLQVTADHQLKSVNAPVYAPGFAKGALLEPLSVVMHGMRSTGLSLGRGVVVCGAGPIGLIALAAARASGAHPIVITDLEPSRLAFAKDFVPSCITYQVDRTKDAQGNAQAIRTVFGDSEYVAPDTVLECTGVESSMCTAAYTARRGSTVMVIGVGKAMMNNLPFMHLSLAEIDLRFNNRYCDTWPPAIQCLSGGILDLTKLVPHVFPLEKAEEALHLCADTRNGSIKVMVVDDQEASL